MNKHVYIICAIVLIACSIVVISHLFAPKPSVDIKKSNPLKRTAAVATPAKSQKEMVKVKDDRYSPAPEIAELKDTKAKEEVIAEMINDGNQNQANQEDEESAQDLPFITSPVLGVFEEGDNYAYREYKSPDGTIVRDPILPEGYQSRIFCTEAGKPYVILVSTERSVLMDFYVMQSGKTYMLPPEEGWSMYQQIIPELDEKRQTFREWQEAKQLLEEWPNDSQLESLVIEKQQALDAISAKIYDKVGAFGYNLMTSGSRGDLNEFPDHDNIIVWGPEDRVSNNNLASAKYVSMLK